MQGKPADSADSSLVASVPLAKHYELQITLQKAELLHVRELMAKDAEIVRVKEDLKEKALELQYKEYERRLDGLNHEAQRLSQMVTREMFAEVIDTLKKEIITLQLWKSNLEGRAARSQMLAAISIIVSAVALALKIFAK